MFGMRFTIFTPILAMTILTAALPVAELDRKTSGIIIPLTRRPSLLKVDDTVNFKLDTLYSHVHVQSVHTSKIQRGFENYKKNMGVPHPLAVKGFESEPLNLKRAGAGASLTNFENSEWYTTISVGTPARPFTVNFDTGSPDLFIPGPSCSNCAGHTKWDPALSRTSKFKNLALDLSFDDGATVSLELYTDNVTITGLTADCQTIGVAITYSSEMKVDEFPADGMLGMAFQSISEYPESTLFETLVNEGKVEEPVFSVRLSTSGGELYLGGSNADLYTGVIAYTDVTVVGFWQVNIAGIQGNGKILLTNIPAIIDTGASFIFGDQSRVHDLHTKLGGKSVGNGFYSFPCKKFPKISFTFGGTGGRMFQITHLKAGRVSYGSRDCFSNILGRELTHWSIGGVFLTSVYTVFDYGKKRVGFADLAT